MGKVKFGSLTTTTKTASLKRSELIDDYILVDHFNPSEDYYLFLLEGYPEDKKILETINKEILRRGYQSYIIASATTAIFKKDDVKQLYEHMKSVPSNWKSLIVYCGIRASAIMAFGAALYSINKGTDLFANEFYATKVLKPYYYLGSGFIGDYNTFIFPVDAVDALYPKEYKKGMPFAPDESVVNFKTRFFYQQLKAMLGKKELPYDMRPYTISIAKTEEEANKVLLGLQNSKLLAFDTETTSLSHKNGLYWYRADSSVHCLTFCNDGVNGYYIPADLVLKSERNKKLFCSALYTADAIVGANIKFDLHYMMWHIPELDIWKIKRIDDTGQLLHAINSDIRVGLKPEAFRFTYFGGYDDVLDEFKRQTKTDDYGLIPEEILSKYATIDAIVTYRILVALRLVAEEMDINYPNEKNQYLPENDQWSVQRWYDEVMMPAYPCFTMMEHKGMYIDKEYMEEVRERLKVRIPQITETLCKLWNVPLDFKFGSPVALGKQIEKMGWPLVEVSKAGGFATNDDCISEWQRQNRPGIKELIEWRLLNSLLNTFIGYQVEKKKVGKEFLVEENDEQDRDQSDDKGWEFYLTYHPEDESYRIHQSYKIMGTTTFRCIGRDPNFQNIPVHAKLAHEVMRCITVPTALEYTIEDNYGNIYTGGELDTVEVKGKGRISLAEVCEEDDIVLNSFKKFEYEYQEVFNECADDTEEGKIFLDTLEKEYNSELADEWKIKYGGKIKKVEEQKTIPVRKIKPKAKPTFGLKI